MKTDNFSSFGEFAQYLEMTQKRLNSIKRDSLRAIGVYLRGKIRDMHGTPQPGWLKSLLNPSSPLLQTGALRGAVSYRSTNNAVVVYTKKEDLANIHEYGAMWKMSDAQRRFLFAVIIPQMPKGVGRPRNHWGSGYIRIPARPIWRTVLRQEQDAVTMVVEKLYQQLFI